MQYISHRVNTIKELESTPCEYGVEVDLRDDFEGHIYLSHDPFVRGDDFEEYLSHYRHGTMILNIKSERIEWRILELLKKYSIKEYFFLDSSFPMIWSLACNNIFDSAIRVSEFESLETAFKMAGKARWIWIDCFSNIPIGITEANKLKECGYKLCMVSPELQGRWTDVDSYIEILGDYPLDAVCAKRARLKDWKKGMSVIRDG